MAGVAGVAGVLVQKSVRPMVDLTACTTIFWKSSAPGATEFAVKWSVEWPSVLSQARPPS
ncbi:hypothetical protein D3C78_1894800 [compost metagenome]